MTIPARLSPQSPVALPSLPTGYRGCLFGRPRHSKQVAKACMPEWAFHLQKEVRCYA